MIPFETFFGDPDLHQCVSTLSWVASEGVSNIQLVPAKVYGPFVAHFPTQIPK